MKIQDNKPTDLNAAQWKAVIHRGSHLLIAAGPGTGKTHTLTCRIAHIVNETKTPERILAVTFTNKAAKQMRDRLNLRLGDEAKKITIGTFHAFCLQVLQNYSLDSSLPKDFRVASKEEVHSFCKQIFKIEKKREINKTLDEISHWKSGALKDTPPENIARYNKALRERKWLDFDDLLYETVRLLTDNKNILHEIQNKYGFIFVDEYQDINEVQHALLKLLVAKDAFITAIGDPRQAIYGFRGSNIRYFKNFRDDFPQAVLLSLDENYRSASGLLEASWQVMAKSDLIHASRLKARMYKQGCLTIYEAPTDKAEVEYVVHQVEKLVGGTSMFSQDSGRVDADLEAERSFGDIAILMRLNSQRKLLCDAFSRSGIPYEENLDTLNTPEGIRDQLIEKSESVHFLTLHGSKGLEFSVVFIIGCEEGLLPLQLDGFFCDMEEERRLFYVGMTRAKERLYLTRAKRRFLFGKKLESLPSRFLSDVKEELKAYEFSNAKVSRRKEREKQQLNLFR